MDVIDLASSAKWEVAPAKFTATPSAQRHRAGGATQPGPDAASQNKGGVGPPPGLGMCDTGMCLAQNAGGPGSSGTEGMGNASDAVPAQGTEAADVAMAIFPPLRAAKVAGAAAGQVASRPGLVVRAWKWVKGLFGSKGLSKEALKSIRSLEQRALEHRTKLDAFRRNPDAFDNKGFLRNAPSPEVRERIIQGRLRHLEQEIRNFEQQIERLRGGG
jgi:hypothetical protein